MALTDETLKGVRMMGEMVAEMVRAMSEHGMTREEAVGVARDWMIATITNTTAKKPTDSLVDYMKTLNPMEPKKQ